MTNEQAAERQAAYACENAQCRALVGELVGALEDVIGWVPGRAVWHTNAPIEAVARARDVLSHAKEAMKP